MQLLLKQSLTVFVSLIGLSAASQSLNSIVDGDSANVTLSSGLHVQYPGIYNGMPAIAQLSSHKGGPVILVASGTTTGASASYSEGVSSGDASSGANAAEPPTGNIFWHVECEDQFKSCLTDCSLTCDVKGNMHIGDENKLNKCNFQLCISGPAPACRCVRSNPPT